MDDPPLGRRGWRRHLLTDGAPAPERGRLLRLNPSLIARQLCRSPTKDYIVYYDCHTDRRYDAMRSQDLKTWEDITGQTIFSAGNCHGTVLKVPSSVIANIQRAAVASLQTMP